MTYNEIIQKAGKRTKKHIYYIEDGVTKYVNDNNVERVKFNTQTPLIGTSIDCCEITLKEPINGAIYVQIEAKYKNETQTQLFGPYLLKEEPIYDANKKTYLHKTYDNMVKSMVDYVPINITYPCSVYEYFTALTSALGYTNNILTLPNGNKQISNDIYNNINFTYRDVLDDIAYANGVLFYIDGNEIKIATLGGDSITIDDDILKNKNIDFGKHYGPINSIVLSRGAGTDNVYLQDTESVEQNGLCEFKIIDNQLMNDNNRSEYLPALLNQLDGIEYDVYDTELTGWGKLRPLQTINFETANNQYSSYLFNNEVTLTAGYKQAIYNDEPKETETDYKAASDTDKKINQTNLIVDKQQGIIESLVSNTTYVSDTKTGVGSIQLENAYKGQLYQLSISGNISLLFPQSSVEYGYPLVPHDGLVPSNTLVPSSPVPYGNEIHYPSSNLFSKSSNLIIDDKEYKLDFDFLNYMSDSVYDEFKYDNGTCYIIRRVGIDSQGDMYALDNEVIEPRKGIILEIDKSSIISLKSFPNAILSATYLLENTFTDNFAEKVEVQSQIKQTADSITEQVNAKVGDDEIVAKLNLAIQDGQGVINLTGNQVTIDSDYFKLDADGNIEASKGTFSGDIDTSKNAVIGDNLYVGQNQQSSSDNIKYIYLADDGYIRRWKLADKSFMRMNADYQLNLTTDSSYIYLFGYGNNAITMSTTPSYGSDIRLKENIEDTNVDWIDDLKLKKFNYKTSPNVIDIGLIAQDYLDKDYKDNFVSSYEIDGEEYYGIKYQNITNALIQYCQELKKKLNDLEERIEVLENEKNNN